MKNLKPDYLIQLFVVLIFTVGLTSCNEVEQLPEPCLQKPPTDELCEAYFIRWFYNKKADKCYQIGYSGCNAWGFDTQALCEECGTK